MTPESLGHDELATLAREYFLAGHLIDRAGMPHVIAQFGRETMTEIAIEEWMGASPIYTGRMRRALGFERDDVAAIFQGMQLDIGAPPEFMDFRYTVHGPTSGEFRLAHCGALMDVEPMGEDYVVAMCHHIEDPTFDATAVATNARAQVRPIHRPPRHPADRHPHCAWTVRIDPDTDPVILPIDVTGPMEATLAATIAVTGWDAPGDGLDRYGQLDPDLRMEHFSGRSLSVIIDEAAVQGHLLASSFAHAVARRCDQDTARALIVHQFTGVAGVVASRLAKAFDVAPDLQGIAAVFDMHPAFRPVVYAGVDVELRDGEVLVSLRDAVGTGETAPGGWITELAAGRAATAVAAIAHAVCDRAVCTPVDAGPGTVAAWSITLGDVAAREHPDVSLTRFSTGADFEFGRRQPPAARSAGAVETGTEPRRPASRS